MNLIFTNHRLCDLQWNSDHERLKLALRLVKNDKNLFLDRVMAALDMEFEKDLEGLVSVITKDADIDPIVP